MSIGGDDPKAQSAEYSVLGMPTHGTFAEYIAVGIDRLIDKPRHMTWSEAAALPLAGVDSLSRTISSW